MAPTLINYVNLVSYAINILFTFISNSGVFDGNTNVTVSDDYLTLVTPAGYTFSIWGLIFATQGVFTIAQFFPAYSNSPLVTSKFVFFWFSACFFQAAWSIAFVNIQLPLSLAFIVLVAVSLLLVVYHQGEANEKYAQTNSSGSIVNNSWVEYFVLIFPFRIHLAWVTAASIVNLNVVLVENYSTDISLLLGAVIVSVAFLVFFSTTVHYTYREVFGVFAWAFGGISSKLKDPEASIVSKFGADAVEGVRGATAFLAILFAILVFVYRKEGYGFDNRKNRNSKVDPLLSS